VIDDVREIVKYLPHRYPFLMIDRVLTFEKDQSLTALKNITANEPIFTGHFPQAPIFPGVLILEAMAQSCAMLAFKSQGGYPSEKTLYLFILTRSKRGISKFDATGTVDGKTVCTSEVIIAKNEIEL